MDATTQKLVRNRAGNRCEYCHLHQDAAPFLRFHIEHVQAKQPIQDDSPDNLALACPDCNRHKGPNLTTLDPNTRDSNFIRGISQIGIATEKLLAFNSDERVEMRSEIDSTG